ncbi:MAG TPA: PLP-dependent aspartate aminotransferase family protein [Steroidobacteraceae bacterium]|nr:PLP-dependent aspartate aminotransferase family protein [Steroidobacteraceae bacterium]
MKFETLAIHSGRKVDTATGAVTPAIHLSTTFERDPGGGYSRGFDYSRSDNPNRRQVEQCIAALEGGRSAHAFASGSAASLAVFSLLRPGQRVLSSIDCYHGTARQLREIVAGWGIDVEFVDTTDEMRFRDALEASPTALVWIETPSNPTLKLSDIEGLAVHAHRAGALVCCDNTFATPVLQRPLELGADLVMHSSTKYFGGHSDLTSGVVVVGDDPQLESRLRSYQSVSGAVPSPFDCWLLARSLATLPYRVRAQVESAGRLAQAFASHPRVEHVFYPGLADHPHHALARRQMPGGCGAIVSILVEGTATDALAVASRTRLFTQATSLGGIESLIEHRASIEGPGTRTPQNLLRLSVGLEHPDDLIADLTAALDRD